MNKRITFRGMDHSPVIEEHCNNQLAKIEEFLTHEREPRYINLVLDAERMHHHHHVQLHITTPNYDIVTHAEAPDMYEVINRVCDTMYHKLHEEKKKLKEEQKDVDSYKGA